MNRRWPLYGPVGSDRNLDILTEDQGEVCGLRAATHDYARNCKAREKVSTTLLVNSDASIIFYVF